MSPLVLAVLAFADALHRQTSSFPKKLVLPPRAFELLRLELAEEPEIEDGNPISGVGKDGRVWLAAIELEAGED